MGTKDAEWNKSIRFGKDHYVPTTILRACANVSAMYLLLVPNKELSIKYLHIGLPEKKDM